MAGRGRMGKAETILPGNWIPLDGCEMFNEFLDVRSPSVVEDTGV
jgi:hypothetical protein